MLAYKLTDTEDFTHYKSCKRGPNVTHETSGKGDLCGSGWLHFYTSPLIALLLNPIHGDYQPPKLWQALAEGSFRHDLWLKSGCTRLTTIELLEPPPIITEHRVSFAIRCAQTVYQDKTWLEWADRWLNNTDRTQSSAADAASAAYHAPVTGGPATLFDIQPILKATFVGPEWKRYLCSTMP